MTKTVSAKWAINPRHGATQIHFRANLASIQGRFDVDNTLEHMSLRTKRLGGTDDEPLSFGVDGWLSPASTLLWHLCSLPGLKVIAKKSWAMTDDFEAYFSYRGRIFVMHTPTVDVWVSLIGQPPDEKLFSEIETHVQQFSATSYLFTLFASIRFFFVPFSPSRQLLRSQGINVSNWWR